MIPDGMIILHHCDNPPCCNPAHLALGTSKDNAQDAAKKGRSARGERVGISRLKEWEVREILAAVRSPSRDSDQKIADRYGVHNNTVQMIRAGKTWAWLDAPTMSAPLPQTSGPPSCFRP